MRRNATALIFALAAALTATATYAKEWGDVRKPTLAPVQIFGGPSNGCIAGAQALVPDGVGYRVVRLSRNRNWGHPQTLDYVTALGQQIAAMGLPPVYIGDLSQPRGGPMRDGHLSHQNGNDVDIWFNLHPKPERPPAAREEIDIVRLVGADERAIDPAQFRPDHVRLLRAAAAPANVDRLLVHYAIKKHLCDSLPVNDRSWLRKLRPWRGHYEHFHVRLACPPGSPDCQRQSTIPLGDGCDATLDWWFADAEDRRRQPQTSPMTQVVAPRAKLPARPKLPDQCAAILKAP